LQIGDEEILIFVNMAVLIWLQYRKFNGLPELTRDGDYLIATSDDRRHFDQFQNEPFYMRGPIIATPLLLKYMKAKRMFVKRDMDKLLSCQCLLPILLLIIKFSGPDGSYQEMHKVC